jgi:hypothetical protein
MNSFDFCFDFELRKRITVRVLVIRSVSTYIFRCVLFWESVFVKCGSFNRTRVSSVFGLEKFKSEITLKVPKSFVAHSP